MSFSDEEFSPTSAFFPWRKQAHRDRHGQADQQRHPLTGVQFHHSSPGNAFVSPSALSFKYTTTQAATIPTTTNRLNSISNRIALQFRRMTRWVAPMSPPLTAGGNSTIKAVMPSPSTPLVLVVNHPPQVLPGPGQHARQRRGLVDHGATSRPSALPRCFQHTLCARTARFHIVTHLHCVLD